MKLVFKKNENGDVSVTMFKGTAEAQFSYIEMIKALIAEEPLDADFDETITKEEQAQIKDVLKEIEKTAKEKEGADEVVESETDEEVGFDTADLPF